jgi:hypothetical protein
MKVYILKSGKKIAFSDFPRPREGDVVFFLKEEWAHIKESGFTSAHKDYLWQRKFDDYRYAIIPEKGLTEPGTAAKYCREILQTLRKKAG